MCEMEGSPLGVPPVWRTSLSGKPPKSSSPTEGRYHDYYLRHRFQSRHQLNRKKQHATTFPWLAHVDSGLERCGNYEPGGLVTFDVTNTEFGASAGEPERPGHKDRAFRLVAGAGFEPATFGL